jgi:hypothetical protein
MVWQAKRQLWGRRRNFWSSTTVRGLSAMAGPAGTTSTKQVMHWPQPPQLPNRPFSP